MKKKRMLLFLLAMTLLLAGCSYAEEQAAGEIVLADTSGMNFAFTERELSGSYDGEDATYISGTGEKASVDGRGARISGQGVWIEEEGTYILSGVIEDCMLTVAVPDDEKVQLVLSGVELRNSTGPAIYVRSADKFFLTVAGGTENIISDGADYSLSDDGSSVDGAVFSRADLCVNGGGSLKIEGNNKHGLVSKDDLVICGCRLDVTAAKQGLNGKDCVKIHGAELRVSSGTDGIQSDNDGDGSRGYIYLEKAGVEIDAGNDGIQAETLLRVVDSDLRITSGGGSISELMDGDASCKGLKAGGDLLLEGGNADIDSKDDCLHANGNVAVYAGSYSFSSGDDGLHADGGVLFEGGSMEIMKSYEGVEGSEIRFSGGELRITASDDGLNLAGGKDGSASEQRPGRGKFDAEDGVIAISGGRLWIDAQGDGIDSNGTIDVSGGVTLVCGPTNNGNAAFDHNGAKVSGGVLIAVGSAGMAQNFTSAENQGAILVSFDRQTAGSSIALCDNAGVVVAGFTPVKDYQSVVITASGLQPGQRYSLIAGAQLAEAGADGFAAGGTAAGGTELAQIEMETSLFGSGGMSFIGMEGRNKRDFRDRGFMEAAPEWPNDGNAGARTPPEGMEAMEGMPEPPEGGFGGFLEGITPPEGMENMPAPPEDSFGGLAEEQKWRKSK